MKTIIATIKPNYLHDIRTGKKIYEIRKTCPKELPFKVLCCESGSHGQIKAEFEVHNPIKSAPCERTDLIQMSCVRMEEANDYSNGKELYFWDINNLVDYCSTKGYRVKNINEFGLKRAPQSWQYIDS